MGIKTTVCYVIYLLLSTPYARATTLEQDEIFNLFNNGELHAAIDLQNRLIDDIRDRPNNQLSMSINQYNLAFLYLEDGQFRKAVSAFDKNIKLLKLLNGNYDPSLTDSLARRAIAQYKLSNYGASLEDLYQAQHIIHRTEGVWGMGQTLFLNWIATTQYALTNIKKTDATQRFRYAVFEKNFPAGSPELVLPLIQLADWFRNSAQYSAAIQHFNQALDIIDEHQLSTKLHHQTLTGLAKTMYLNAVCCADKILEDAAKRLEKVPAKDESDISNAYLEAGDMSLLLGHAKQGEASYSYAARLGQANNTKPIMLGATRVSNLVLAYRPNFANETYPSQLDPNYKPPPTAIHMVGSPIPICSEELKTSVRHRDYSKYVLDISFVVLPNGQAANVSIKSSNAPSAVNNLMRRMLTIFRFRPKLVDGKVTRDEIALRQTFHNNSQRSLSATAELASAHACHLLAAL